VAAPTLTSSTSSDYTDNAAVSEVTGTLTWNSGDRILVVAMTEDQSFTLNTPTATGLTFSALGSAVTPSNSCWLHAWEATAAGSGSSAVTATRSGGTGVAMRGIYAFAYGGSTGFARTNKAGVNATETVSVTRTGANSAIVFWSGDWSASGTGGIGWTPAGQTQLIAQTNTGATAVVGRWGDQGATGTTAYGTTGLAGTAFTVSAVEVLGSAGASPAAGEAAGAGVAQTPTTAVTSSAAEGAAAGSAFGATVSSSGAPAAGEATAAGVAHDPTVSTSGGGTQSLFTSETPAGSFSDGAPGIATATTVRFAQAGQVSDVAFYASSSVSGTYTAALYSVDASDPGTGTLLGSATMGSPPTPSAWNTVPITPVAVTAGVPYRAVIFSGDGRYVATSSFFSSDLVNGDITADANGDTVGGFTISQGTYRIDATLGYPNSSGGGSCYFVDVVFSTTAAGSPDAGEAPATGVAHGPTAAITANGTEATATGTGHAPIAAAGANTATATAAGAAQTPAVSATVTAGTPTAAGTAEWDTGSSISLDLVADNPVTAAGVAFDATVSTASAVSANAADAAAAGVSQDPAIGLGVDAATADAAGAALGATVTTSSSASAPAGEASGAGAAQTPTTAVTVDAGAAAAVGQALDPTVSTFAGTAAPAGEAAASGTADSPAVAVVAFAGVAESTGAAADPSVLIGGPGSANAGDAAGTGTAYSVRVRKLIPRPYTGVIVRPYTGVVPRP
jgi:hypothetical protein